MTQEKIKGKLHIKAWISAHGFRKGAHHFIYLFLAPKCFHDTLISPFQLLLFKGFLLI